MLRYGAIFLLSGLFPLTAKDIDLVQYGKETFHALGCAECHSEFKDDTSVKSGPGLYGLLQDPARERDIIEVGENHRHTVKANFQYYAKSVREPAVELAIAESGPTKGQTYLPVMPAYPVALLTKQKTEAIFHYLRTLNDKGKRGPAKVMKEFTDELVIENIHDDPAEVLVTDRTRIFRARIGKNSARAIYVGTPSGLNYSFDPRNFGITRIWWGGFLNIREELTGRAGKVSALGHQAQEINLPSTLLIPLHPVSGKPVDLSFKSPKNWDTKTISANLNSKVDFETHLKEADARFMGYRYPEKADGQPTFFYEVGANQINVTFTMTPNGTVTVLLEKSGPFPQTFKNNDTSWTLPVGTHSKTVNFQLPEVSNVWRPRAIPTLGSQKVALTPAPDIELSEDYSAEQIPAPTDPHGRPQLFEPMGMATADDGSIIVTTRTAGVWKYNQGTWTMIAEGLLDALGVVIENKELVVGQKPELTRLHDKNGDGFYDHYQTLSDDFLFTSNYHEYLHGPAKGRDGNYYIGLNLAEHKKEHIYKANSKWMGTQGARRGWALQVTPEGKTKPFAYGLRSPAGFATGPDGKLYYTENQGEYNGTSKLHHLQEQKYYGHPASLIDLPGMTPSSPEIEWTKHSKRAEVPLALLPHARLSNSPGSPAWDLTEGKFGPFKEHMFIGDQTLSTVFRVLPKPKHEAAIIPFGQNFPSGVMRLNFGKNGALYVGQTGRGWRAKGGSEHALIKVTYQESPASKLTDITRNGATFTFHFTKPITTNKLDISVISWSYHDKPDYGSPENNHLEEKVSEAKISDDRKRFIVTLKPNPARKVGNRVLRFYAGQFPRTTKTGMKAFYSISQPQKIN